VSLESSISDIKELLRKYGCERVITDDSDLVITNKTYRVYTIAFQQKGIRYIVQFPVTTIVKGREKKEIIDMKISGRIVYNKIKSLLVDVEIGYLSFSQAMIQFVAIPTPNGDVVSMAEYVESNQIQLQSGINNFFQIGDGHA
jgi:hypothetical protein